MNKPIWKMNINVRKWNQSDMKLYLLFTTIALATAGYVEQKSVGKGKINKLLSTTFESSTLQCLHRCKFIDNDAKAQFNDGQCKCLQVNDEENGSVPDLLIPKRIQSIGPVKPGKPVNVALGKPSKHGNGDYGNKRGNAASNANDGDYNTRSASKFSHTPYWRVDLQEVVEVKLIKLFLSEYAFENKRYPNLKVKIWVDDVYIICKDIGTPGSMQLDITCDTKNTKTGWVRVEISVNPWEDKYLLYLNEVEVYTW